MNNVPAIPGETDVAVLEAAWAALTPKQATFVEAYQACGSASKAYREAYDAADMLPASVNRNAFALLRHIKISPIIAANRVLARDMYEAAAPALVDATVSRALGPAASAAEHQERSAMMRLASEGAGLTGKGSTINVNVDARSATVLGAGLWEQGGADAWRTRHEAEDTAKDTGATDE